MTKEDDAAKILRQGEDPSLWLGVQIGQRWYQQRGAGRNEPAYVNDLQLYGGQAYVHLINHAGRSMGKISLESFLNSYEQRA